MEAWRIVTGNSDRPYFPQLHPAYLIVTCAGCVANVWANSWRLGIEL